MQTLEAVRLKNFVANWQTITSDQWILNAIQGCQIEFEEEVRKNDKVLQSRFSHAEEALVEKKIEKLLEMVQLSTLHGLNSFTCQPFLPLLRKMVQ